jgi:FdhE protein
MPGGRRIVGDMSDIGEQAKPPFAVLPDPSALFLSRAERLAQLAGSGHQLGPYLDFLAKLASAQHAIVVTLPPVSLPSADLIARAQQNGMPPIARGTLEPDGAMLAAVEQLAARLRLAPLPAATAAAVDALVAALPSSGRELVSAALKDLPADDMAQRVLILAGLQVHFTRLAAMLDAEALTLVANAACPSCGSPPVASSVVGWPKAYNTRYCTCSLCGTMWNVIRVMCVLCGSTDGVSFRSIEDQPDTVKAETCESCRGYVKIVYQVNDVALEPLSDDVASVGLDMLLAEEGWKRGSQNPFLLGY